MRKQTVMVLFVALAAVVTAAAADEVRPAAVQKAPSQAATAARPRSGTMDRLELDTTSITGNRELPKVMYVVPWKRADIGDLGRPLNSLVEEVLTPVDREVFGRQINYFRALEQGPKADAETPVTAGARAP